MICAGSRVLWSSGLAITADPPTGRCHTCNTGSKHLVKVGRRSKPKDDHKAEHMFSYRHKKIAKKLYPKCFINTSESFNCFSSKVVGIIRSLKTKRENLEGVFTTFSDLHNVFQSIFVIFLIELRKTTLFILIQDTRFSFKYIVVIRTSRKQFSFVQARTRSIRGARPPTFSRRN